MEDPSSRRLPDPSAAQEHKEPAERVERLSDDVDAILDEIDEVMEENAEEFVRSYVQRGGNGGGFGLELAEELKQRLPDEDSYRLFDLLYRIQDLPEALQNALISERWGSGIANLISDELSDEPDGIYYFLQNLAHFGYEWEPGRGGDVEINSATAAHEELLRAQDALLSNDINNAHRFLVRASMADPSITDLITNEYGFILAMSPDSIGESTAKWITRVWAAFSDQGRSITRSSIRAVQEAAQAFDDAEGSSDIASKPTIRVNRAGVASQHLGSLLENDTMRLFEILFRVPDETRAHILRRQRRQTAGAQMGRDLEFDCTTAANERVRCHVECKNYSSPVSLSEVAGKLAQEEMRPTKGMDIDHWILISPRASASNQLNEAVDHWNASRRYPFQIQLWTPDSDIHEFFALEPSVYQHYFDDEPIDLLPEQRTEIVRRWRDKIKPHVRVDPALVRYLTGAGLQCFADESMEALESIRNNAVPLSALDPFGSRTPKVLKDVLDAWLSTDEPGRLLLVGDFGDGKTFFTYTYSRWLCEQFMMEPQVGTIPLRIPLRRLQDFQSAPDLVRARLDEVGVSPTSWEQATHDYRTLVFLDGFDEISSTLDDATVAENVARLMQCCREFPRSSIVITSRAWFFESGRDRELILPRIGSPKIWRIMPIARKDAVRYLQTSAADDATREKVSILRGLNDPLGLACKPLFMEMIRQTLPTLPEESLTEVQLYQLYTNNCLLRKLEDIEANIFGYSQVELIKTLHEILSAVAVRLQETGAPAVNLRLLGYEFSFADVLWQMTSSESQSDITEDATQRVGVRSLLRRMPSRKREEWLVDFFHRSIREYYAARGIVSAIDRDDSDGIRILTNAPLVPEIKWFACEMIKLSNSDERLIRIERLARREALLAKGRDRLGGNCVTLLAGVLGRLPSLNWSGLALDYADLTGTDLSHVDFSSSSLRYSVLDDATLENVDFSGADLTGLRLEETADVEAVVGQEGGEIFAAYADGSLKKWRLMHRRVSSETVAEDIRQPIDSMAVLPNGDVALACSDVFFVYRRRSENDGTLVSYSAYRLAPEIRIRSLGSRAATAHSELGPSTELSVAFTDSDGRIDRRTVVERATCSRAYPDMVVAYGTDQGVRVELWQQDQLRSKWIVSRPGVTSVALSDPVSTGEILVVAGHRDGTLEMCRIDLEEEPVEVMWTIRPHHDVVSCLELTSQYVISGSPDRSISVTDVESGFRYRCLQRTARCKGMIIDGVRGIREREMLRELITRSIQRQ